MGTNEAIIAALAIFLGMMVVLIPIAGLTARFALKPLMEALRSYRELQGDNQAQQLVERRLALMEEQMHSMDRAIRELSEESEFRRDLESGKQKHAALPLSAVPERAPAQSTANAQSEPLGHIG
jgi:TolA-binding protein